jgi:PDZ domain-containing protein
VTVVAAALLPVPWVIYSPGPSVDVLGDRDDKPIIEISGRQQYRDEGDLRLLTVVSTGPDEDVNLLAAMVSWAKPDTAVYPRDAIYKPGDTEKSVRQESAQQMTSSQDNAVAAALDELGIKYQTGVQVREVDEDGPSSGVLRADDVLVAVNGRTTRSTTALQSAISSLPPGTEVELTVRRQAKTRQLTVKTAPNPEDPEKSRIGVGIAPTFDFPFDVDLNISDNIGGPSAGMVFAIGIYDVLTPGSLVGGKKVAGTGEIDPDGNVLPVGGVQQKIAAAQRDGAHLFLVPADNCAEATTAHYDEDEMRIVRADDVGQAIEQIKKWVADPEAQLTGCTR